MKFGKSQLRGGLCGGWEMQHWGDMLCEGRSLRVGAKLKYLVRIWKWCIFQNSNDKTGQRVTVGFLKSLFSFRCLFLRRHNVYSSRAEQSPVLAWLPHQDATKNRDGKFPRHSTSIKNYMHKYFQTVLKVSISQFSVERIPSVFGFPVQ